MPGDEGGNPADGAAGGQEGFDNPDPAPDGRQPRASDGATPRGCNDLMVTFDPVIPSVLLVIDRSGSMFDMPYGGSPTRWAALEQALVDPMTGIVARYQDRVRFGLLTYTSDFSAGMCPILRELAPALDNYEAIRGAYQEQGMPPSFKAETPTGAALRAATDRLAALDDDNPKHILLVTDGEPDDCTTPDPQCGQNQSIGAVQAAFRQGIGTSVVGVSSDVSSRHLQDLANAGSGQPVQPADMQYVYNCVNPGFATLSAEYAQPGQTPGQAPIHQPSDAEGLGRALDSLIRGVSGCSFELHGEVDLDQADLGTVLLDGESLGYRDANGWRMQSTRVLELLGTACERVQTESRELLISFPCDVVEVF